MKFLKGCTLILLVGSSLLELEASGSLKDGMEDRLFEKKAEYKNPGHYKNDYQSSPFYVEQRATGKATPKMMEKTLGGDYSYYAKSFHDKPVTIGDEISIVRTSTTQNSLIKTTYDKKGNIISIHGWERRSGKDIIIGLDALSEPIIKDEIESTVAKLRIVYNAYGEVISKAAWNKITGEKITVPAAVPFTNYINEDKYWAWVERQKLYDRSYENLYVDRGAVRTRRMKKLTRYGNPFGIPQEIEVYEERPIVERHFEDAHYGTDGYVGIFSATLSGSISGKGSSADLKEAKSSYLEFGVDAEIARHSIEVSYRNLSQDTTIGAIANFDGKAFAADSDLSVSLSDLDFTYRKEWNRSERGEFGLNWLFSLKYLDFEASVKDSVNNATIEGGTILPTVGIEGIKNMSDHIDLYGSAKVFQLSGVSFSEIFFGAKYYFHPENVDDWRASLGYKSYDLEFSDGDDKIDLGFSGVRFSLERGF